MAAMREATIRSASLVAAVAGALFQTVALLVAVTPGGAQSEAPQAPSSRWLRLGEPFEITGRAEIFRPFSVAIAADGDPLILDFSANIIIKLDGEGNEIWRAGGTGLGPGEFQTLYRMDAAPDGLIAAYDLRNSQVSWFSADGEFVGRGRLPVRLRAILQMVALRDGVIALSGVAPNGGETSIWLFDRDMQQVATFGPLPDASDEVLRIWGAGSLSRTPEERLLFSLNRAVLCRQRMRVLQIRPPSRRIRRRCCATARTKDSGWG